VRRSAFLSKAGWSWGYVSAIDSQGRTIWIADAHRDEKLFVVHADEKLTAFWNSNQRLALAANDRDACLLMKPGVRGVQLSGRFFFLTQPLHFEKTRPDGNRY